MEEGGCSKIFGAIVGLATILGAIILVYQFITGNMTLPSALGNLPPTATSSVVTPGPTITQLPGASLASQAPGFIVATISSNLQAWLLWIILGLVIGCLNWWWNRWLGAGWNILLVFGSILGTLVGGLLASNFFRGTSLLSFIINIVIALIAGVLISTGLKYAVFLLSELF